MSVPDAGVDVLEALIGHAVVDPLFREFLLDDPEAAAASLGYAISKQQANRIKHVSKKSVDVFMASFQEGAGFGIAEVRPLW